MSIELEARCKIKSVNGQTQKIFNSLELQVDVMTNYCLFKKNNSSHIMMLQGGSNYYVFLTILRGPTRNFVITTYDSLVLFLSNGEKIVLSPCGNFGAYYKALVYTSEINCAYKIEKEQLKILAGKEVDMVSVHYTSKSKLSGSQIDQDGKLSLDYEVSKMYKTNIGNLAQCILNR